MTALLLVAAAVAADPSYTLSFPDRQAHLLDVSAQIPVDGDQTELFMATWTPGSYLIREFARNVEGLEATRPDGSALPVTKSSKNRWTVDTSGLDTDTFTLTYRVYCNGMNVRANFVDSDFAMLNGAPTFIVPADLQGPYTVTVERPAGWARTLTQLAPDDADTFAAESFDWLVDSPIVVGNPSVESFVVEGVEHLLVDIPDVDPWNHAKAAAGVKKVVEAQRAFWGQFPYERYLFLNVLGERGGGLEHLDSTLMITSRFNTEKDDPYERWLGLVSHELFHAWNVKRLRPAPLGPFDYENEVYTESLWIAEGFTSYYDDVLLARAGLIDQDTYLERMSTNIERLLSTPGRQEQPVSRASYDAWIKYYRGDENSVNTAISYYTKGAVIAFVLDARIRKQTNGERSLDDAMRLAYDRYSGDVGYTPEQFVAVLSEVAGVDMAPFVDSLVNTTDEVPLTEAYEVFGLKRKPAPDASGTTAWLGIGRSGDRVTEVRKDGPAWAAGVNVGDEILAVGMDRATDLSATLDRYEPGDAIELLVSRRGRLRRIPVTLASQPTEVVLQVDDDARKRARKMRDDWIGVRD
jgi:predicted metalloprotease with PDZ domain